MRGAAASKTLPNVALLRCANQRRSLGFSRCSQRTGRRLAENHAAYDFPPITLRFPNKVERRQVGETSSLPAEEKPIQNQQASKGNDDRNAENDFFGCPFSSLVQGVKLHRILLPEPNASNTLRQGAASMWRQAAMHRQPRLQSRSSAGSFFPVAIGVLERHQSTRG